MDSRGFRRKNKREQRDLNITCTKKMVERERENREDCIKAKGSKRAQRDLNQGQGNREEQT